MERTSGVDNRVPFDFSGVDYPVFTPAEVEQLRQWLEAHNMNMDARPNTTNIRAFTQQGPENMQQQQDINALWGAAIRNYLSSRSR